MNKIRTWYITIGSYTGDAGDRDAFYSSVLTEEKVHDSWNPKLKKSMTKVIAYDDHQAIVQKLESRIEKLRTVLDFYAVHGLANARFGEQIDERLCREFYINGGMARQALKDDEATK